jgi:ribosomal protein S18 acetylase RimI-like enzyme
MEFVIRELDQSIVRDLNRCNSEFVVDSKLILRFENNRLCYTTVSVPEYTKRYAPETVDYSAYVGNPEKTAYLAYVDGQVAGQIVLRRNWNRFAWIEDIRVDIKFRRSGIGRELLAHGEIWARQKGFPGIMLETQDSNVGACRFYERYGFVPGGFDTYLYRGANRYREEIALFWYLVFDQATSTE